MILRRKSYKKSKLAKFYDPKNENNEKNSSVKSISKGFALPLNSSRRKIIYGVKAIKKENRPSGRKCNSMRLKIESAFLENCERNGC